MNLHLIADPFVKQKISMVKQCQLLHGIFHQMNEPFHH
uniref:Uncharacterized protein n=1 Tax=Lotus japonicus TaxID=34305 RepID=I3T8M8_LOTJA|nr:unknown [Lotus japonicus]